MLIPVTKEQFFSAIGPQNVHPGYGDPYVKGDPVTLWRNVVTRRVVGKTIEQGHDSDYNIIYDYFIKDDK